MKENQVLLTYNENGTLPPGEHTMSWEDVVSEFGTNEHRRKLLAGLRRALMDFAKAGCSSVLLNGSFITKKELPGDYDAVWIEDGVDDKLLDPVLLDYEDGCKKMKEKYLGEFYPFGMVTKTGMFHGDFFQMNRDGTKKGIVKIDHGGVS